MQVGEGAAISLVVFDEPAEASGPGEGALDDPAPGQQHEAALGLGQFHDPQFDAVPARGCGRLFAGVALIDEGDLDVIVSGRLHDLGQMLDLSAVIGVGRRDVQGQKMAERVHRSPLSGVARSVRLSRIAAEGSALRATPTERVPFFGNAVSSITRQASGPPTSRSAVRANSA